MNSKGFGSLLVSGALLRADLGRLSGPLRGLLGRLGSVLGRLGGVFARLGRQNRLGAVLEPSLKRLGGVLGTSWAVSEASWGRLVGLFEVSWAVLWAFGNVWGRLGGIFCANFTPKGGYM